MVRMNFLLVRTYPWIAALWLLSSGEESLSSLAPSAHAFQPALLSKTRNISLLAKKKRSSSTTAKGFGKQEVATAAPPKPVTPEPMTTTTSASATPMLQSIEGGTPASTASDVDDTLTAEERAKKLLRETYGMKTLEEQQMDAKQYAAFQEQKKKVEDLKKKAEMEQLDIMMLLPAPLIVAIDRILKIGVVLNGIAFILGGLAITVEAWSKTTGNALPTDIDSFIVDVVEPNFTYGLLTLLGFSVSLGLFAAMQLGSKGAQYRED